MSAPVKILYTIGHSNQSLEQFIELLQAHRIQSLADIRSLPGSKRLPHFNAESLVEALPAHGISYLPMKGLGGRRKAHKDSPNTGWRHPAFQGYADYMMSREFVETLESLLLQARKTPTAIMCAEAVPWRCHRNLVADAAVLLHGWEVRHIMTAKKADIHQPMSFARVRDDHLIYPADDLLSGELV